MNRKIKFRVWNKALGMWSVDNAIHQNGTGLVIGIGHTYCIQEPDKYIWCQYTGCKDKRGIEIYEGDILKYEFSQEECSSFAAQESPLKFEELSVVEYRNGAFRWQGQKYGDISEDCLIMTVVGNIFENFDLLWNEEEKKTMEYKFVNTRKNEY
jgi:uncharacterized phage protein (TIGR01671 family)